MSLCYGMKDGKLQVYNDGIVQTDEELEEEIHEELVRDKEIGDGYDEEEDKGIILSDKHGINASISTCLICSKDIGIVLFGRLEGDKEAPKTCCIGELCENCKSELTSDKKVVILDETGRYVVVPEEYLTPEGVEEVKDSRVLLISSEAFNSIVK